MYEAAVKMSIIMSNGNHANVSYIDFAFFKVYVYFKVLLSEKGFSLVLIVLAI